MTRLEEPWSWFERVGEHKDLIAKVKSLRASLDRPLVVFDIGLNIGSASWAIARACPDCIVYGFEPIPSYFAFAESKMPRNEYPNVHLFNYAICDHVGEEKIWMDPTNIGWNTLIADQRSSSQVEVPMVCVTIDRLMASSALGATIDRIDLIKIDTEGAERMVLDGMHETITRHPTPKPWMYIEIGWGRSRSDWNEEKRSFQFLFENGYETYDLDQITGTSMHWMTPKSSRVE